MLSACLIGCAGKQPGGLFTAAEQETGRAEEKSKKLPFSLKKVLTIRMNSDNIYIVRRAHKPEEQTE